MGQLNQAPPTRTPPSTVFPNTFSNSDQIGQRVAQAVVKALRGNPQEVYVRSQPTRPLLSLIALRPELGGRVLKAFGVDRQMKQLFTK